MIPYTPPLADMRFVLRKVAGLGAIASLPGYDPATPDTVAARRCSTRPPTLRATCWRRSMTAATAKARAWRMARRGCPPESAMRTKPSLQAARPACRFPEQHGSHGLPRVVATAVSEMWSAANLSFALCPLLTAGAAEALEHHGSEELKALYLPKLVFPANGPEP